jgi:hypothetical protein
MNENSSICPNQKLEEYFKANYPELLERLGGINEWLLDYSKEDGLWVTVHDKNGMAWEYPADIIDTELETLIREARNESLSLSKRKVIKMNIRDKVRALEPKVVEASLIIEKGTVFNWSNEEWTVKEVCLNKDKQPTGYYLCHPSNPWSDREPCYWTEAEIKNSESSQTQEK